MSGLHSPVNGNGASAPSTPTMNDAMPDFYGEVSSIDDMLSQFNSNVARISELHSRSLNSMDEALSKQNHAVLDELVASTRTLGNDMKNRIQNLEKQPAPPGQGDIRKNQTKRLRNQFLGALQKYQTVEQDYRRRYRERVERQFKIVKPDATPEEVTAVVNDDNGAGGQVFSQALMSSTRYGEGRAAYREVQERHEDIRKIEHTLTELAQLFNDMSILIEQQDEAIKSIETAAEGVATDTEAGLAHTEKAVKSARAARKKRWICFFIFLIILAIIGIVVGVVVSQNVNKK
ncbi:t-SNARE [Amylostereum chailletii]|nr:t-SNARE [Amylostereum chailletii]